MAERGGRWQRSEVRRQMTHSMSEKGHEFYLLASDLSLTRKTHQRLPAGSVVPKGLDSDIFKRLFMGPGW